MEDELVKASPILIVDDEASNAAVIERTLERAGYTSVQSTNDPRRALPLFQSLQPDLVVLDLHMPEMDGFEVMAQLAPHIAETDYLPILVLTGDPSIELRRRALAVGAKDFLNKPFDRFEVLLRIWNLLETRHLYGSMARQRAQLAERVDERTQELADSQREVLERLAAAVEYKDFGTGAHARRVANLACELAKRLGVDVAEAELVGTAALLHDVGKISLPDAIQLKEGPLTEAEWEIVRRHTSVGAKLLGGSSSTLLRTAEQIARSHHERWDGEGYPDRLAGEGIPLPARIVAAVDAYDAMIHDRPYRRARSVADAIEELRRESGRHFDPRVVEALIGALATESEPAR